MNDMMDWMPGGGWLLMVFWGLLWLLVLAAIVAGVVLLVRARWSDWASGPRPAERRPSDAMDILRERFARGEIDRQEFEERRRVLAELEAAGR